MPLHASAMPAIVGAGPGDAGGPGHLRARRL